MRLKKIKKHNDMIYHTKSYNQKDMILSYIIYIKKTIVRIYNEI